MPDAEAPDDDLADEQSWLLVGGEELNENAALRLELQQVNSDAAAWKVKYEAAAEELQLVKLRVAALTIDNWHLLPAPLLELIERKSGLPLQPQAQKVLTPRGRCSLKIPLRDIFDPRTRFNHTHDFEKVWRCKTKSSGVSSLFVCKVSRRGSGEAAGD